MEGAYPSPAPGLYLSSAIFDASRHKWIPIFLSKAAVLRARVLFYTSCFTTARRNDGARERQLRHSVGGAATDALHLSQKVDLGRPFDSRTRHFGLELIGGSKGSRPFHIFPFEEKRDVVDVSCAAENPAAALSVFVPPIEVGIESRLPGRIIGDFVVDQKVDHDLQGTPFTVKRCYK